MEILTTQTPTHLLLALRGRLDATWSPSLERALAEAVRTGRHVIRLDMEHVDYMSSAGLGVLLYAYKELLAIEGSLGIEKPSRQVAEVLALSGLGTLLSGPALTPPRSDAPAESRYRTASADWCEYRLEGDGFTLRGVGKPAPWNTSNAEHVELGPSQIALGIGAFGEKCEPTGLGEFMALGACAAQLPPGTSQRPDFLMAENRLVPTVWVTSGLVAEGGFARFARFDATQGAVGFSEVAAGLLGESGAVVFAMAVETAGLVGASLLESPAFAGDEPFAFPGIRDRLGFTSERAFRDGSALIVGVLARPGSAWDAWLRPAGDLLAHAHAAVFPYRPLQRGCIDLGKTVTTLFETKAIQSVLHLISDPRGALGAGESDFYRGACWVGPVRS